MDRRFNVLMLLFSFIGGIIGYFAGEALIAQLLYKIPDSLLMGIYFGQFAFFVGIMCLAAEMISPVLNGPNWRRMYTGYSWKLLVPCTLAALFLLGTVFQFIYGLDFAGGKKIGDIAMLVDTSESMVQTDPQNKRFDAVKALMDNMKQDNRISIFVFNDDVVNVQPMSPVTENLKNDIIDKLGNYTIPSGRTNIKGALENAAAHIKECSIPDRSAMVILLSDGGDNYNLVNQFYNTIEPYKNNHIPIFTVGMAGSDVMLLNELSDSTGGRFYSVDNAGGIGDIFNRIYNERDMRLLMGERNGLAYTSVLYAVLRVLFITLIGLSLGFGIGLMFDNRYIAKGLAIGGSISGIAAGLILELGFSADSAYGPYIRLAADIILACVFTLFTLMVSQGDNARLAGGHIGNNGGSRAADSFSINRDRDRRSF